MFGKALLVVWSMSCIVCTIYNVYERKNDKYYYYRSGGDTTCYILQKLTNINT